jgi:Skp family chaperone for outer membrane proteins
MNRKIMLGFVTLIMLQSSSAAEKCADNGKICELDPFAPAVVAYGRICSELQPQNAAFYRAAVKAIFNGHEEELKQLDSDTEFQGKLRELRKTVTTKSKADQDSECDTVLSMGKDVAQQRKSRK